MATRIPALIQLSDPRVAAQLVTTRESNRLYLTLPRTTFSSKLPNHNFAKIWNEFDITYQQYKRKDKAKTRIPKQFIYSYLSIVCCHNPMCNECNTNHI